ncbi:MAG: hypothetical protein Q4G33_01415 [bacterium]|nr:hypothetical protein [bacterium]
MKKLYRILRIAIGTFIGGFIGGSIGWYCDYKLHPDYWSMQPVQWYIRVIRQGIFTAVIVVLILIIMRIVKNKSRK